MKTVTAMTQAPRATTEGMPLRSGRRAYIRVRGVECATPHAGMSALWQLAGLWVHHETRLSEVCNSYSKSPQ